MDKIKFEDYWKEDILSVFWECKNCKNKEFVNRNKLCIKCRIEKKI